MSRVTGDYEQSDGPPWLESQWSPSLTQVCSVWRRVALNAPALWTYLDLTKPKRALALSRRFPRQPLRIMYNALGASGPATMILDLIMTGGASRVVDLRLSCRPDVTFDIALGSFGKHAPALTNLDLEILPHSGIKLADVDTLLRELQAPNLLRVRLKHLSSPEIWRTSHLLRCSGLRSLSVDYDWKASSATRPTLSEILDVLGHLQSLEHLRLASCLAEEPTTAMASVCIASLRTVDLSGTVRACICLLAVLPISHPYPRLRLQCFVTRERAAEAAFDLWDLVDAYFELPELSITMNKTNDTITVAGSDLSRPDPGWASVVFEGLSGSREFNDPVVLDIFRVLKWCMPRFGATTFGLSGRFAHDFGRRMELRAMFVNWPSLRHLDVYGDEATMTLLDAIRTTNRAQADPSRSSWVLPNLASLKISGAVKDDLLQPWFEACLAEMAIRCLIRLGQDAPTFRMVMFVYCSGIEPEDLEALKEIVPEVDMM
ncbi:hypothetical protein PUNSTDRAFT_134916 [Punctularia strigosozonata HHB-11173 SS5]|uniref:uncharacterized protein n=1 Tax=Punctularia strigosozonata (strain HHB-11173) TaxID=741275 RepID=UPI000441866F|nr:uncharacterized protein PUNSTDRAFT_134916 [Punctularia strigosozonata HHB-11173 SS5]EIN08537.1 hypothetical protein PUNSTDRAFT_134916 [Punctularia strigosozonata HHB-11173 SS5]